MNSSKYNGITDGVIWKQLMLFFLPVLLGTFFQQLYNTVDAVIVGRFVGKEALAAVGGSSSQILNLLIGFFTGVTSGAAVIVAQYYGARDAEDSSRSVHTAMILAIACGAIMTVVGILTAPALLRIMETPEDTMADSIVYMRWVYMAMIPGMVYNMGSAILRAVGDSKHPLYFLIACCLINVVLDLLFVVTFKMGVAGAAIATALSQLLSAVMICWFLARPKTEESVRLELSKLRTDWRIMRRTVHIGLPSGLQAVLYSISNMIILTAINRFGTDTAAAWVAMGKVDAFTWLVLSAMGLAVMTFVGQNFGANSMQRVRESIRDCMIMTSVFAVLISALFLTLGKYLLVIFTTDQNVIALAMRIIYYIMPWYLLYVPVEVYSGSLRGIGDTLVPFIITAVGICIARVVWIFTIVPLHNDISTVAVAYPITWGLTSLAYMIYFRYVKKHKIGKMEQAA
ncbi:MAG: MATE family efflux transporter [Oscillospiraceae bacterium]|nr:MATE family efflux transporter [Oscillospiraceae bacterium]